MRLFFFIAFTFLSVISAIAQIDMSDSTFQAIGYWDMNEMQSYKITEEKFKIEGSDTTSSEFFMYEVDITIVDSTANSYTIDWFYHDYDIQSDNEIAKKIYSIVEESTITIITNEMGVFQEVVNWEEIRDYIYKGSSLLKEEFKDIPNMDGVFKQIENMYNSKASIEAAAIKEIQQFYTYHGGAYKLHEELNATMKAPNLLGGDPFDTYVTLWLDEINLEDSDALIRMQQSVDSDQLTKASFDYLVELTETMEVKGPSLDNFPTLINDTYTASIIHESGWIIYSIETKEVSSEKSLNVEERTIEIL